jgi:formate dehydrogenase subunit delta
MSHDDAGPVGRMSERSERNPPTKLIYMANQIGKFWISQGSEQAPDAIAQHIKKFWDPRMRAHIVAHLAAGGAGLDPMVRKAVEQLAGQAPGT